MADPLVMFVDDDENLLMGLKRKLRGKFNIDTALGPLEAIENIKNGTRYAVCVAAEAIMIDRDHPCDWKSHE